MFDGIIASKEKLLYLVLCMMECSNEKISVMEEMSATSCAVQIYY
jgi:hypothetical protein